MATLQAPERTSWLHRSFELQDPHYARLLPMEGLRGCAVLLVFLHHYAVQAQIVGLPSGLVSTVAAGLRTYGNMGVELFFILSGYLIYGTLIRRAQPFGRFVARRVQRIYPTFLVTFAVALALHLLQPVQSKIPSDLLLATAYLAVNLALLPGLFPFDPLVTVAWSLSYEMFFYAATAAMVSGLAMGHMVRERRIAVLLILAALFVTAACLGILHFPVRMLPFFAGMLLAEGLGARVPIWLGWIAPLVGLGLSVTHALPTVAGEAAQTVAFFCLRAVCFREAGQVSAWMKVAPLRWLGNMSYSYYLAHGFVVRIAMVLLARALPGEMPGWLFWAAIPTLFLGTLVVSGLLFLIVEKPLSLRPIAVLCRSAGSPAA